MISGKPLPPELEPRFLIGAYTQGYFPMADDSGSIGFHRPDPRAIFPLQDILPGKHIRKVMRSGDWKILFDTRFQEVMKGCASRNETWISEKMIDAYQELHLMGVAHSVEVEMEGELVGGLYGIAIGGAFFGESMFNVVDSAAKIAFYALVAHLRDQGFVLLDSQYLNAFTETLGAIEISAEDFDLELEKAVHLPVRF
jgi:leucyl/phenylalanyl-tRNA--protein transferase